MQLEWRGLLGDAQQRRGSPPASRWMSEQEPGVGEIGAPPRGLSATRLGSWAAQVTIPEGFKPTEKGSSWSPPAWQTGSCSMGIMLSSGRCRITKNTLDNDHLLTGLQRTLLTGSCLPTLPNTAEALSLRIACRDRLRGSVPSMKAPAQKRHRRIARRDRLRVSV